MSEKTNLKVMQCPTCGASLNVKNSSESVMCVYCGNVVIPVATTVAHQNENASSIGGVLKVEGIKTSSSALAYIEQFFEEYDWESFAYAQTLSVCEIDELVDSLKSASADDKKTWFACFEAIYVPFVHKIEGCKHILASVIEAYKNDNLDAYSSFDAYKRITSMIALYKQDIISNLNKIVSYAEKYGASPEELNSLNNNIENIKNLVELENYSDVESIPEVKTFIADKNVKIAKELEAEGINAENEYFKAKSFIEQENYVEALNVLRTLKGYSDSNVLIKKIDKYYLIFDVLEIEGKLYYFKKDSETSTLNLYPTLDGEISKEPIIKNIGQIITNYADILYFLDGNAKLKKFNLSANKEEKLFKDKFDKKFIYVYKRKVYLLANREEREEGNKYNLVELDLAIGEVRIVLEGINSVLNSNKNMIIYNRKKKLNNTNEYDSVSYETINKIYNVETYDVIELGTKELTIEKFVGEYMVYTQLAPNKFNRSLYVKNLASDEPEVMIEQNIFEFFDVISDKLFYYIGNSSSRTLININLDGSDRKEWPLYISKVLFEQGGWIYFTRNWEYNSVLCKSRLDGSKFSIIASDIDRFIDIKNGYLYYINYSDTLVKVRMDGSNLQELCEDVEEVLSVKEEKIVFLSVDDRARIQEGEIERVKTVKSIYAVDFSGSGKIKLVYNVKSAKEHDEDTVYYVASKEIKNENGKSERTIDELYKLEVETNNIEELLKLEVKEEPKETSAFTIVMIFMAFAFIFSFIGFVSEAIGFGVFSLIVGFVLLFVGIGIKTNNNNS